MAFRAKFFFTPQGAAAAALSLIVLARALSSRNVYEIVLGAAAAGCGIGIFFTGFWRSRRLAALEPAWKAPMPVRAGSGAGMAVAGLGVRVPPFFRLHFVVKGRFFPAASGKPALVRAETSARPGEDTASLDLDFPLSGLFKGQGACRLRDVFGLFSFACGTVQERAFPVQSAPCMKKNVYVNAYSGAEDRRVKNADEERYYMREYAPGDRFRDINWKSSERIAMLITRISPDNQEKVNRIEVCFRNFGPVQKEASLRDLWLLDRSKARLAQFLRSFKEEQSKYAFSVSAAQEAWEIRSPEELEGFLDRLAALPFAPPRNDAPPPPGGCKGALYVFSTACDPGLPAFLLARQPNIAALFLVRPFRRKRNAAQGEAGKKHETQKHETLSLRDFPARGFLPLPRWFIPGKERDISLPSFLGSRVEIDYGEVTL